jgi:hypothetical protein
MTNDPQGIDRTTREYNARVQALWTGVILAAVLFVASFLHFSGKQTDMVSNPPSTTGGSASR